jgi:acyl-CoA thioester hydrolase
LVHEARSQFTALLSFDTMVVKPNQVGLIIADLVVNFKSEAFNQDSLEVNCQFGEVRERSVRLFYCIRRTGQVIALVETGLVAFDYQIHKVVQLPEDFLTALEKYRMGQSCKGLEKLL